MAQIPVHGARSDAYAYFCGKGQSDETLKSQFVRFSSERYAFGLEGFS